MKARLHTIKLPIASNSGASYSDALRQFEDYALCKAGGFTRAGTLDEGAWRDPADGTVYREWVQAYEIACPLPAWADIVACAFRLFPDQLAIFTARIGEAVILDRPEPERNA
jgi:hypothetical protein